jgi:hypothetical protein
MKLNDLIDRLTKFRDNHGCIPVAFNYGAHFGTGVELLHQTVKDEETGEKMVPSCILNIYDVVDD